MMRESERMSVRLFEKYADSVFEMKPKKGVVF